MPLVSDKGLSTGGVMLPCAVICPDIAKVQEMGM